MIRSGSLLGELAASTVGEEVSLSDTHFLLLLRSCVDRLVGGLVGRCGSGKSHRGRHVDGFVWD